MAKRCSSQVGASTGKEGLLQLFAVGLGDQALYWRPSFMSGHSGLSLARPAASLLSHIDRATSADLYMSFTCSYVFHSRLVSLDESMACAGQRDQEHCALATRPEVH